MRRALLIALRILLGLAVVVLVAWRVEWARVGALLLHASPQMLLAAALARVAGFAVRGWRWWLLSEARSRRWTAFARLLWEAELFNMVAPSTLGGDVYRAWRVSDAGTAAQAAASVIMDRAVGLVVLVLLALVVLLAQPAMIHTAAGVAALASAGLVLGMAAAAVFGAHTSWEFARRNPLLRHIVAAAESHAGIQECWAVIRRYRDRTRLLVAAAALSAPAVLLAAIYVYLAAAAAGISVGFWHVAGATLGAGLVGMLPIFWNGVGGVEATMVALLKAVGVAAEEALVVALLARVVAVMVALAGGVVYLLTTLAETAAARRQAQRPGATSVERDPGGE